MRVSRFAPILALLLGVALALPGRVEAQGVTTAAISGRVVDQSGGVLGGAQISVRNTETGFVRSSLSNATGVYFIPGLAVGGPYEVTVTNIGFSTETIGGIFLSLGQNLSLNFAMRSQAIELAGIDISVDRTRAELINPGRTGAEQRVSEYQIQNLPTISRNFTDFIALSPLVGAGGGATSVGQQNNRFNNIQIDGALSQDLFGLGSTGQPGGQAGARSISIEAVKEYQILTAPFDVRRAGFSGGLINAVTRSGTNDFRGSVFLTYRNQDFVRQTISVAGTDRQFGDSFKNQILGFSLGGPIIQDKLHFFTAVELEQDTRPAGTVAIGQNTPAETGINVADADRFKSLLSALGVNPGEYGPRNRENPNTNVFTRLDWQLSPVHHLTLRNNFVKASDDIVTNRAGAANYSLDSNWYQFTTNTSSTVLQLNSSFPSGFYNEFTAGWNRTRDRRAPNEVFPVIYVTVPNAAGAGTRRLYAGAEYFSQGNELDQDSWEITNNLTFERGRNRITLGVQDQIFQFRNLFWPGKTGEWVFNSLADLEARRPSQFNRNIPYAPGADPTARFTVNQFALYGQTEYKAADNLSLVAGLRYDVPFVADKPGRNEVVEKALGRRTDEIPSGNGIISPRFGFNWDVFGDQTTQVRGGVGLFTGRHPYVWLSNLYSNTGLSTLSLTCRGTAVPAFSVDAANPPAACAAGAAPVIPTAVINLADKDFRYPSNLRFNAAVDRELPFGVIGTAEFVYTRANTQIFVRELNVDFANPVSVTQGGRYVYGTHQSAVLASGAANNTLASPKRISRDVLSVVELVNTDSDRSWTSTVQLQKRYAAGLDLNGSYTLGSAKDLSGLTSSIATSNIGYNPVQGGPNYPVLSTSDYETRHKVVLSGGYDINRWLSASVIYLGNSGDGYSYAYDGDVNADGFEATYANNRNNDLLYVPTGRNDISLTDPNDWTRLSQYIESEACLRENKGQIISRNACSEPWRNSLDARLTAKVPTIGGRTAEITLDVQNFLNLMNESWGRSRGVAFQTIDLLELRGWDYANRRGIFRPTSNVRFDADGQANPNSVFDLASRWQMNLGVRFSF